MGQRLVVSVQNKGKELATVYYHWGGYTVSALYEVSKLVKCIFNHKDETEEELKLRIIRFCEKNNRYNSSWWWSCRYGGCACCGQNGCIYTSHNQQ